MTLYLNRNSDTILEMSGNVVGVAAHMKTQAKLYMITIHSWNWDFLCLGDDCSDIFWGLKNQKVQQFFLILTELFSSESFQVNVKNDQSPPKFTSFCTNHHCQNSNDLNHLLSSQGLLKYLIFK